MMKDSKAKTLEHHCGVASSPKAAQPAAPKASVAKDTRRTTANLNIRRDPSTGAEIIKTVPKGAKVQVTGKKSGTWARASHTGKTGWMSSKYLR